MEFLPVRASSSRRSFQVTFERKSSFVYHSTSVKKTVHTEPKGKFDLGAPLTRLETAPSPDSTDQDQEGNGTFRVPQIDLARRQGLFRFFKSKLTIIVTYLHRRILPSCYEARIRSLSDPFQRHGLPAFPAKVTRTSNQPSPDRQFDAGARQYLPHVQYPD
ncbi:hypothetical protein BDN67DRAFT_971536 [Paxillus ammoniavirescens]|nr:hypothetical protein BDN67DRAFT_971536 [Paxillus ammoniavirescens]